MVGKRLFLQGGAAVLVLLLIAGCAASVENLQQIRLSEVIPMLPSAVAPSDIVAVETEQTTEHTATDTPIPADETGGEPAETPDGDDAASVFFVTPGDGDTLPTTFDVVMGAAGLDVEPSGEIREGAGHMHILVDEEFVAPGDVVLTTDTMIHFGKGQLETTLELEPGEHTLRLQFANGAHIALDGDEYRDEITVTVAEDGDLAAADEVTGPAVFFVTPGDSDTLPTTFDVVMGAAGLDVEPSGEIREGAGHMHILVDEEFVAPGDVVLTTDTMIHFGKGQLETTLELEPGEHTLRLQFADGAHIALDGDEYRDEITVIVAEGSVADAADEVTGPAVFFVTPGDGDTLPSTFDVVMGAAGLDVEPSGEIREGAGHMHILVDEEFVAPGDVVLTTDTMIHFGKGQLETTLELEPGKHTLRLQFANGAHIALDGDGYRDEITVTVAEDGDLAAADEVTGPAVFFVTPVDGDTLPSTFDVVMGAAGLAVEPSGEIREGAGHMHILVDEEFVAPGDVVLTTDTMIHFGKGQLETTLELETGEHTLRLQFADGAHIALDGDEYRDEITVMVAEDGDLAAADEVTGPAVFFVTPGDGDTLPLTFDVVMGAAGLDVEPSGEIREGAGHMHILVDEEFVAPGDVVLTTDTMIHFGKGQLETTLELEPGEHTLRLQFANGAHIALDGDEYRDEITVTVQ